MIQTWVSMAALTLHQVDLGEVDRAAIAIDEQDDGQADADLGGGDGDDEQGEDLPGGRASNGAEAYQVDVARVEDQLDRHQHERAVLAGEDTVDAGTEQERGQEQVLEEVHQRLPSPAG